MSQALWRVMQPILPVLIGILLIEVALGLHEPAGRLPIGFPASMDAVEAQLEDVGRDAESYVDSAGNTYEFGFGLNHSGPIS